MPSPQIPRVQLPSVELPTTVQFSGVQLPSVQLPEGQEMLNSVASSAAGAADSLMHLPGSVQQQLQLLQLQLQDLATSSATYEPHFGSHAFMAWLREAFTTLSTALHVPMLQLPGAGSQLTGTHILLHNSSSSSISGALVDPTATLDALAASWRVLSASVFNSLPSELSSVISQGADSLAAESTVATAALVQLQQSLTQAQDLLQQLPEHGMSGYDFPTLCLVAAGAIAATAASVPGQGAVAGAGGVDDISDDLTHEYDPEAVARYFQRRPILVMQRSLQLAMEVANFGLSLLGDMWTGRLQVRAADGGEADSRQESGVRGCCLGLWGCLHSRPLSVSSEALVPLAFACSTKLRLHAPSLPVLEQ